MKTEELRSLYPPSSDNGMRPIRQIIEDVDIGDKVRIFIGDTNVVGYRVRPLESDDSRFYVSMLDPKGGVCALNGFIDPFGFDPTKDRFCGMPFKGYTVEYRRKD